MRGNARMRIFLNDGDYRWFLYLLGETLEDARITCWNYCAMPNHVHLTLCPSEPNLSNAMRNLNSRYAQWWNKKHERVGHVFQGRFKDQIVQREGYLLELCRYVALNPVRAELVKDPRDWPWSSFAATAGLLASPAFLAVQAVLSQFGDGEPSILQARYAEFVVNRTSDLIFDRIRSNEHIIGDQAFKTLVRGDSGIVSSLDVAAIANSASYA